jgi:dTDP-glucose 4,6-dehydratase
MKLLVTGGAGFIGSNFIRLALSLNKGYSVVNFDKLTYAGNLRNLPGLSGNPNYKFTKGDVCDTGAVESALVGCDAIVHFAAESHVDRSIAQPADAVRTNVSGTLVLLQAARKLQIQRFVHISSDEVYGDVPPGFFPDESFPLSPSSPYSASKASADLLVLSFVRTYGFPALITRCSNNYGPGQFMEKFLPLMIARALAGTPLPIYGDGLQQRNWLHVDDNCRAILAVLERGRLGHIYNIGGADARDNLSMARDLLKIIGKPESLIAHVADRPGHDRRYALDSKKIRSELGWEPSIWLDDGLRQTVEWYRKNFAG